MYRFVVQLIKNIYSYIQDLFRFDSPFSQYRLYSKNKINASMFSAVYSIQY